MAKLLFPPDFDLIPVVRRKIVSLSDAAATALHTINDITVVRDRYTLHLWHNVPSNNASKTYWATHTGDYQLATNSIGKKVRVRYNNVTITNSGTFYQFNEWHHFCITFGVDHDVGATKSMVYYLDGVEQYSLTTGAAGGEIESPGTHYLFGDDASGADSSAGYIGDLFDFCLLDGIHPPNSRVSNFQHGRWVDFPDEAAAQIYYRLDGRRPGNPGFDSGPHGNHFLQDATGGVTTSLLDLPPGANTPLTIPKFHFLAGGASSQTLNPGLMATEESYPGGAITTGVVDIAPDALMATEEAFPAPSVGHGITAALVVTEEAFHAPTVTRGAVDLSPDALVASEESSPFIGLEQTPSTILLSPFWT